MPTGMGFSYSASSSKKTNSVEGEKIISIEYVTFSTCDHEGKCHIVER